jgi:hypothetical protein
MSRGSCVPRSGFHDNIRKVPLAGSSSPVGKKDHVGQDAQHAAAWVVAGPLHFATRDDHRRTRCLGALGLKPQGPVVLGRDGVVGVTDTGAVSFGQVPLLLLGSLVLE